MKKDQNLPNKIIHSYNSSGKPFPDNHNTREELFKIVLDARYLNSLIDESKCNWPIEPIQVILTKKWEKTLQQLT